MGRKAVCVAAALAVLQLPLARAEATPGDTAALRALTLPQALTYARDHHPRLRSQQDRVRAALASVDAVRAQWLPTVGAMAQLVGATANNSTTTLLGTQIVDLPRVGATSVESTPDLRPYASTAVAVGLRQQLFDFGRLQAEATAQRMLGVVEELGVVDTRLEIETGVTDAFHAVAAAHAILHASRAAEQRARQHAEMAETAVRAGLRASIELSRAEADKARYEVGALRAESGLRVARTLFAAACGVSDQELEATETSAPLDELWPLGAVLERQRTHDPVVRARRARAAAEHARAEAVRCRALPSLYASASLSGRAGGAPASNGLVPPGEGFAPTIPNWHAGVVMAWPAYDPAQPKREQAARLTARAMDEEVRDVERTRRARVTALYEEARVAAATLTALERAVDAARAHHALAEQRFSVGLGSSVELSDAETLIVEAEVQWAVAKSQALRKRAELARAIGGEP